MPYSVHDQKESTNQSVREQENKTLYRSIELKNWDFKRMDTNTWCFIGETVLLSLAGTRVELFPFIILTNQPVVIDICPNVLSMFVS